MTKFLTLDEMHDVLATQNHPTAPAFARRMERLGNKMAKLICHATGAIALPAKCESTDFGGTCVGFIPAQTGDPIPQMLAGYD